MKFTTATALFAISASVASAAPAYNSQVPISKAATTTTPSVEQPSIILDYYTVSSVSDKTSKTHTHTHTRDHDHDSHSHTKTSSTAPSAVVVNIQPVGQGINLIPSGISIHTVIPTTIVSNGMTTVSSVESVSFLHFGPGPARVSPRTSTTPSSTVAAYTSTSTPVAEQLQAGTKSSGLPFTLNFGFPAQATASKSSYSSVAATSASRSTSGYVIPSYKTTVYSTIYAKPSTISVVVPKSTITSVVSVPGTKHTVTYTVHQTSAKPYVSSSSGRESATYEHYAAASSSASSSSSSSVSRPFTLNYGFQSQHSTLVTSVRPSTTAAAASYATPSSDSSSTPAGLPFTLHYGFPMRHSSIASATKSTAEYGAPTQSVKSTPVVYTTTSYAKVTPIAAYASTSSAEASPTTKKSYFGIF